MAANKVIVASIIPIVLACVSCSNNRDSSRGGVNESQDQDKLMRDQEILVKNALLELLQNSNRPRPSFDLLHKIECAIITQSEFASCESSTPRSEIYQKAHLVYINGWCFDLKDNVFVRGVILNGESYLLRGVIDRTQEHKYVLRVVSCDHMNHGP